MSVVPARSADLVAAWNFADGTGAIAKDTAGNHLDGRIENAARLPGRKGAALGFQGSGGVRVGYSANLDLDSFPLPAWAYLG